MFGDDACISIRNTTVGSPINKRLCTYRVVSVNFVLDALMCFSRASHSGGHDSKNVVWRDSADMVKYLKLA